MNMNYLSVVTPPPDIYHGFSTFNKLLEEKFTPVNITSCVRFNIRKHSDTKNDKQYIILDISSKLDCMDKRKSLLRNKNIIW